MRKIDSTINRPGRIDFYSDKSRVSPRLSASPFTQRRREVRRGKLALGRTRSASSSAVTLRRITTANCLRRGHDFPRHVTGYFGPRTRRRSYTLCGDNVYFVFCFSAYEHFVRSESFVRGNILRSEIATIRTGLHFFEVSISLSKIREELQKIGQTTVITYRMMKSILVISS